MRRRAALLAVPWAAAVVVIWLLPGLGMSAFPTSVVIYPAAVAAAGWWHRSWRVAGLVAAYLLLAAGVFLAILWLVLQGKPFMSV